MLRLFWLAAIVLVLTGPVVSEPQHRRPAAIIVEPQPEGMGCYWYRQRQYCGRYCYREIDGRRYCRERAREAYPQGLVDFGWLVPMK